MHDRSETFRAATNLVSTNCARTAHALTYALVILAAVGAFNASVETACAQETLPPAMEAAMNDASAPPMTQSGGGNVNFFSQDLGTIFRMRYNTESYGQDGQGNFSLGTMQVVTLDDTSAFVDGQVNMNDKDGVGFNLGLGYRWMTYPGYSLDGRMEGVSIWADGTHTQAGNFFPQLGVSYESLGEVWDFRANGYIPVGDEEQVGQFRPTDQIGFQGTSLSQVTVATADRFFYAADLEIARRLGAERDAWGFAGPYFVANDNEDSPGARVGVRGYAYPDLAVQVAVSHDDVFETNASFSVVWFVGRTRTNFCPAGSPADHMREPVWRNDYVVLSHNRVTGGIPLTDNDGNPIRILHVDSDAAAGGDGSFERPFDNLPDVNGAGSQEGDIILAHSTSVFTGEASTLLKDRQRLLGEGNNVEFTVVTAEEGTVTIPESSPGARALARPQINGAIGDAIVLADENEVANFDIDGQGTTARAIASPVAGAGNPNLHDLAISNTTGNAIEVQALDFVDTDDIDNDTNVTETIIHGNLTVNDVTLTNVGGNGIDYTATAVDVTQPNMTLQEVLVLGDITSTGGTGRGIAIRNTHSGAGRTTTLTNYTYDGLATSLGGIQLSNFDGAFNASTSSLTNGAAAGQGVQILGDTDGTITFADTVTFTSLDGTAIDINGDDAGTDSLGGTITFGGPITNDTNRSVVVQNIAAGASVTFNGDITDTGTGILANSNSGGLILFAGDLTMTTEADDAITLTDNTGATIDLPGRVQITTTSGDGFVATGGGTLSASAANNTINTESGQIAVITGMTIADLDVRFSEVNRTTAAATSGLQFENNTGTGFIEIGTTTNTAGETGTIEGGAADTIVINNSANVTVSGVIVNNAAGFSGVHVTKNTAGTQTTNLNAVQVNDGDFGVEVTGGGPGAGALNMNVADSAINDSTAFGLSFDNVDVGTINVDNTTLDGNQAGAGAVGVRILNSNATFNFDSAPATDNTLIQDWGGTDFLVDGGTPNITFRGSIINASATNPGDTTGRSVVVQNTTGGVTEFTTDSTITDDNAGMLVDNNANAVIRFNGTHDLDTTTLDAVTVTNNDGTTAVEFESLDIDTTGGRGVVITGNATTTSVDINNVDITTTSGNAFVAQGGGDLTVSGDNNVIQSTTGTGLIIEGMDIDGQATFESVTVANAANGIVLRNLTGAQVTVGEAAGAANSGGTLTTTGDAIVLENVANADFQHVQVVSSGAGFLGVNIDHTNVATGIMDITFNDLNLDTSAGGGIDVDTASAQTFNLRFTNSAIDEAVTMDNIGAGAFRLLVDNTDIITTGADEALSITFAGATVDGDVTIQNGSLLQAANARAFDFAVNNAGASVELKMDASTFNSATLEDANIVNNAGAKTNANITNNTFANSAAGNDVVILSDGAEAAGTRLDLNLLNNGLAASTISLQTTNAGAGDFNFGVVARDTTDANNPATVTFTPLITDFESITGPVESPTVP